VQVLAAKALGPEGVSHLERLALERTIRPQTRVRAFRALQDSPARQLKVMKDLMHWRVPVSVRAGVLGTALTDKLPVPLQWLTAVLDLRDPEMVVAAAALLGRDGGRDQVEVLQRRSKQLFTGQEARAALLAAVGQIQGRLAGGRGDLACVDPADQAGTLSVAQEPGRLSINAQKL
jgi:hypothetical protein